MSQPTGDTKKWSRGSRYYVNISQELVKFDTISQINRGRQDFRCYVALKETSTYVPKVIVHSDFLFQSLWIKYTVGGIANICFKQWFKSLRMHTQRCQGCQKIRNFVRNTKILIARSTIQPKLSKIKKTVKNASKFIKKW